MRSRGERGRSEAAVVRLSDKRASNSEVREDGESMTILIVEDDADTRKIYQDALENHGYRVLVATQGAEGVSLARRVRPDLILMDIRMPVMDGRHAMRFLKASADTSQIPIFAISAYASPDDAGSPRKRWDFDRFLAKPLELDEIIEAIEERIGPPSPRPDMPQG